MEDEQSPVMNKAWTFVYDLNMDDVERERALASERARVSDLIVRSEERKDGILMVAKNFLSSGFSKEDVAKNTGLSLNEIETIIAKMAQ